MKRTPSLLILALATACATSSDVQKLQSQITELQEQLAQVRKTASSKEEVQSVNVRIAEQTQALLKSNATLVAKVDAIEDKINNTQGAIEQTNYRLDGVAQQITQAQHDVDELKAAAMRTATAAAATQPLAAAPGATPTSVATPPAAAGTLPMSVVNIAPPPGDDPVQMYQNAYRDYQRSNYDLAVSGFRDFIAHNPSSELVSNATYWIGESLFAQKKYQDSIAQFDSVVTKYPKSDKVAAALLKKGYAYLALGERAKGIVQLQYVVHEHPRSHEAALATQRLKQLGVETR